MCENYAGKNSRSQIISCLPLYELLEPFRSHRQTYGPTYGEPRRRSNVEVGEVRRTSPYASYPRR